MSESVKPSPGRQTWDVQALKDRIQPAVGSSELGWSHLLLVLAGDLVVAILAWFLVSLFVV
jgi:hypothetical protein